jgi:hypothetical protein
MSQISIHDLQAMADKMASIDFSASVTIIDVPKSTSTQRASLFDTWDAALANLLPVVRNAVVIPGRDHGKQVELPDIGLDVKPSLIHARNIETPATKPVVFLNTRP